VQGRAEKHEKKNVERQAGTSEGEGGGLEGVSSSAQIRGFAIGIRRNFCDETARMRDECAGLAHIALQRPRRGALLV